MAMDHVECAAEQNEALARRLEQTQDAQRKLLKREGGKREAVSEGKRTVKAKLTEEHEGKITTLKQAHSEALEEVRMEVEVLAEALSESRVEKHRKSVCVAQERARTAEKKTRSANRKRRKVELELERARESEEEPDDDVYDADGSETSESDEEEQERPDSPLPPPLKQQTRRDTRGRWKAEHWKFRVLRWSQLARGRASGTSTCSMAGASIRVSWRRVGALHPPQTARGSTSARRTASPMTIVSETIPYRVCRDFS